MKERLAINEFRAAYLCAGPSVEHFLGRWFGESRVEPFMEDLKKAAGFIADSNVNFAIVPYNVGYPASLAEKQSAFFQRLSTALLEEGVETIALISAGPYLAEEEWKSAPWGAVLPGGEKAYHSKIANIRTACWNNHDWRQWLRETSVAAVNAGAGGLCMDAPCFGATPLFIDGVFEGPAGCHCPKCRDLFQTHLKSKSISGKLPARLGSLKDVSAKEYVKWRADIVSAVLQEVKDAVEAAAPSALFVVSAPHAGMLPTAVMFGLDPRWALSEPDVCVVENNRAPAISGKGLWYQSPTAKALHLIKTKTLIADLGYVYDMSSDSIPSPFRTSAAAAYPLASSTAPVVRYGEFRNTIKGDNPKIVWMLGAEYSRAIEEIAPINNWLDKNGDIFEDAAPVAEAGVLFSWKHLNENPSSSAIEMYYKLVRTLTEVQVPVMAVSLDDIEGRRAPDGLKALIIPDAEILSPEFYDWLDAEGKELQVVFVGAKPERAPEGRSFEIPKSSFVEDKPDAGPLLKSPIGKWFLRKVYAGQGALYGGVPLSARAGMPPLFLSKFKSYMCLYQPPAGWETIRKIVIEAIEKGGGDFTVEAPPYVHVQQWRKGADSYYHCVNLLQGFPGADHAVLKFRENVSARVIEVKSGKITYHSSAKEIALVPSPYSIVHIKGK